MANDNSGNGNVGGKAPDGHAVRRADGWENSDTKTIGWLPDTPVNPAGGAYQPIGPGSKAWASTKSAKTLGDTRKR
jgi:hypothetical protein